VPANFPVNHAEKLPCINFIDVMLGFHEKLQVAICNSNTQIFTACDLRKDCSIKTNQLGGVELDLFIVSYTIFAGNRRHSSNSTLLWLQVMNEDIKLMPFKFNDGIITLHVDERLRHQQILQ
jgi:hypothetical protein